MLVILTHKISSLSRPLYLVSSNRRSPGHPIRGLKHLARGSRLPKHRPKAFLSLSAKCILQCKLPDTLLRPMRVQRQ
jgi:hypothetical protein